MYYMRNFQLWKTNLMLTLLYSINGLKFQNVYLFSKTIFQPKYQTLAKILNSIDEIGFYIFDNNADVPHPSSAKPNSIFIFDDVACDKQNNIRNYYCQGRHSGVDVFYLCQSYAPVPKHLIRDNANLLVVFKQDNLNFKRLYDDHVNSDMTLKEFKSICDHCWSRKYGFIVIDKDRDIQPDSVSKWLHNNCYITIVNFLRDNNIANRNSSKWYSDSRLLLRIKRDSNCYFLTSAVCKRTV